MTVSIPIVKINPGGTTGLAFHNPDGTITISLPAQSVTIDRETADKLAEYLQRETN
jgi:hypothetical protein